MGSAHITDVGTSARRAHVAQYHDRISCSRLLGLPAEAPGGPQPWVLGSLVTPSWSHIPYFSGTRRIVSADMCRRRRVRVLAEPQAPVASPQVPQDPWGTHLHPGCGRHSTGGHGLLRPVVAGAAAGRVVHCHGACHHAAALLSARPIRLLGAGSMVTATHPRGNGRSALPHRPDAGRTGVERRTRQGLPHRPAHPAAGGDEHEPFPAHGTHCRAGTHH